MILFFSADWKGRNFIQKCLGPYVVTSIIPEGLASFRNSSEKILQIKYVPLYNSNTTSRIGSKIQIINPVPPLMKPSSLYEENDDFG